MTILLTTPCIETANRRCPDGYGHCNARRFGKRIQHTHVVAWVDAHGRLPGPGMQINHHCDNPPCINSEHLYEGSQADNVRDRDARGHTWNPVARAKKAQTHCIHDHEFTPENTIIKSNGTRACRACRRDYAQRYYLAHRKATP